MSQYHQKDVLHFTEITLLIRSFKRSLEFYVDILGFSILEKEGHRAILSANGKDPLITLIEDRNALAPNITLGLYHYALLLPNRKAFAQMIHHIANHHYPISGMSDHGVSEAIYLDDPDGHGIEIYWDKPIEMWPYENNELNMYTQRLDLDDVMSEIDQDEVQEKINPETILGHLHFYVDDLEKAKAFFCDILGFQVMMNYLQSALFVSDGGYHHHLGLNTWNGNAPLNQSRQIGLKSYALSIPHRQYTKFLRNLSYANIHILSDHDQRYIIDPLGQKIYLSIQLDDTR